MKPGDNYISADVIAFLQRERNMTLGEIGSAMGKSEPFISRVKNGQRLLTLRSLSSLSVEIGMPLPLLLILSMREEHVPRRLVRQQRVIRNILAEALEDSELLP